MRRSKAVLLAAMLAWPPMVAQAPPAEGVIASRVEIMPRPGTALTHGERLYLGPMSIVGRPDGIGLVETVSPEDYLLGIREVPFSWHAEALKAQVVAARTYLAFTLAQGRSTAGRQYGYDICATSACQVYAGPLDIEGPYGDRWQTAVEATAGEILIYDGAPAQALYSSTSGVRTRESEDIFLGLDVPYLAAVESPGEQSPFVTWSFAVSELHMQALLEHAGLVDGSLRDVTVETTTDGAGPWMVVIESDGRTERVPTYQFRGFINRAASALIPEVLPAPRGDGRRYPQTILSGTYLVRRRVELGVGLDGGRTLRNGSYVFSGWGWGHQVGMSQYGAQAMAEGGAFYDEILGHYYTGLAPTPAAEALPVTVAVALAVGVDEVMLTPDGPVDVMIDGVPVGGPTLGSWRFLQEGSLIRVIPPVGLGLPARIQQPRIRPTPLGDVLFFAVNAPAQVVVSVSVQDRVVSRLDLGGLDAGNHQVPLAEIPTEAVGRRQRLYVTIEATNPDGADTRTLVIVPEIR